MAQLSGGVGYKGSLGDQGDFLLCEKGTDPHPLNSYFHFLTSYERFRWFLAIVDFFNFWNFKGNLGDLPGCLYSHAATGSATR